MTQIATVEKILPGGMAEISVPRKSACGHDCEECAGCGVSGASVRAVARNDARAEVGQKVVVDTRNGTMDATVSRVDPGVTDGTVIVDADLKGALLAGARPHDRHRPRVLAPGQGAPRRAVPRSWAAAAAARECARQV